MAGRWELGFPKTGASSLKEQLVRTTLHNVRSRGHPYLELRQDGKRFVFFCTLCLAPCYSDSVLFDHLKGNLHTERLSTAKLTLLKENPWPFSDGVQFFDNSCDNGEQLVTKNEDKSQSNDNSNVAIVKHGGNVKPSGYGNIECDKDANQPCDLLIQGVLVKDGISDLRARFLGFGKIAARFSEKDDDSKEISRIWCEWSGENTSGQEETVMAHEFAVVTFAYNYDLGRKRLLDDVKLLLYSSPAQESENGGEANRKRKKSFSDPEDVSESFSNQYDSSGVESMTSVGGPSEMLLDRHDHQLLHSRNISNKSLRRELRRQHRIAAERMCDICQQKILPEKDVATLINMKTGKLACSSRNAYGQFHVFHTSCLIHWMLLCECEMARNQSISPRCRRKSKRTNGTKSSKAEQAEAFNCQIRSVFCPECQGTGVIVDKDERELPTIPLSEMFKYKIRVSDGRRAWMKSPELLENCSIGFHFPSDSERTAKEMVVSFKLLHFYRVDE